VVGQERVDQVPGALDLGQLAHPLQVGGPLGVQVPLRVPVEHEGQHDLGEEHRLQVRLGGDGLGQPGLEVGRALLGDHVPLAVGSGAGLRVADHDLAVARQPAQRGVELPERERLAPAEQRVVVALEVVAVAGLALEEAEQGQRDAHAGIYTLGVYLA